ncbi:SLAP domain-containing protein [Lactobacillus sp. ESL0791]|uniref:SLAP domain-containing protein n=1 Tax=Lactobacillus sp. ESL0791 TaxID=2983234 RepID=UPI0023F97938|nr:SLAP domain-containing protein [Lactobacillus sp. ESL0791]MDF7638439.1 SLAP domain-containing protein [Lactobacillus sp. ESL0791]
MKKSRISIMLIAALLVIAPVINISQVQAETTTQTPKTGQGTLILSHDANVYDKNGNRLTTYAGGSAELKAGTSVKHVKRIKAIKNPYNKRYSFHDSQWKWYYLPFTIFNGKKYYAIADGGYIRASKVQQIDGHYLYTNRVKYQVGSEFRGGIQVFDSKEKNRKRVLKPGQRVILDRSANDVDLYGHSIDGDDDGLNYRLKGTNQFIDLDANPGKQLLLPMSNYMDVYLLNDAYLYTDKGEKVIHHVDPSKEIDLGNEDKANAQSSFARKLVKGDLQPVANALYIWVPEDQKAELFYELQNKSIYAEDASELFVKAADVKYAYGPKVKPSNTAKDAEANKQEQ